MSATQATPEEMAVKADAAMRAAAEIWTYLILGWLVTCLRTYSRVKQGGWRNVKADDYMAWLAAIFYALESGAAYASGAVAQGLANNGMSDEQRLLLTPADPEWQTRVIGSKIQLTGWTTYIVMVWCLKASLLLFYLRLTPKTDPAARMRVFVGLGVVVCSWLAVFLTIYTECIPFEKNWQIYPDSGNSCSPASSVNILWVSVVMNILSDIYIMITPIPMLWRTSLRPAKKAALIMLFSCGIFVIACAVIRTSLMLDDPVNSGAIAGLWSCRETFVATIASNLPAVFPLLKLISSKFYATVTGSLSSGSGTRSSKNGFSQTDARDTFGARSSRLARKRPQHPTLGTTTFIEGPDEDEADLTELDRSGGQEKNIQLNQVISISRSPPGSLNSADLPVMPQGPLHDGTDHKRRISEV